MASLPKKASSKAPATTRNVAGSGIEMVVNFSGKGSRKRAVFQFGSATLKAPASHEDWARNIGLGQAAMKKIKTQLIRPGVKLRASKSTPLFRTDPANPRQLIRVVDGREERGVFEGGVFKVLP
jgi:hypothetical protein